MKSNEYLNNAPAELLKLFDRKVEDLRQSTYVKSHLNWKVTELMTPSPQVDMPNDEVLIAFLTKFRQFYFHKNEPIRIANIYEAAERAITDPDILERVHEIFTAFKNRDNTSMRLNVSGVTRTPKEVVQMWISQWFHSDNEQPDLYALSEMKRFILQFPMAFYFRRCLEELELLQTCVREAIARNALQ